MKTTLAILIGSAAILASSYVFAACGSSSCGDSSYGSSSCGSYGGGCGSSDDYSNYSSCSGYSSCQCADLSCNDRIDGECMSGSTCCEAFGNIGAR